MGHGFIGDTGHHHTIAENIDNLKKSYSYANGYFGEKGQGRHFTRNIYSNNPLETAKDFYAKAACGGIAHQMSNHKGEIAKMKDGTIISFRSVTSSVGSPAVEINISSSTDTGGLKRQKIHFAKR